jgi:DNA polymerase I-like protein with 3'-5' exonuclease and polymerase domains
MSPLGRFRHLPEMALDTKANEKNKEIQSIIHSAERQALNHAIQSVSSDAVLLSCLEIMKVVDPEECRPVLFIHDELTMEVLNSEIDKYAPIIKYHMINPPLKQFGVELNLPLDSDLMVGTNLAEMEEWKPKDKEATE